MGLQRLAQALQNFSDDDLVHHVAAFHRDIGLRINGIAGVHEGLQHGLGIAVLSKGRLLRLATRRTSSGRSALSHTEIPL